MAQDILQLRNTGTAVCKAYPHWTPASRTFPPQSWEELWPSILEASLISQYQPFMLHWCPAVNFQFLGESLVWPYYETPLIQTPMTSRWLLIKRNPWPTTFGSCSFASKFSKFSQLHVKASDWQSSIRISVSWTESSVGPVELWWVLPGKFYIKT